MKIRNDFTSKTKSKASNLKLNLLKQLDSLMLRQTTYQSLRLKNEAEIRATTKTIVQKLPRQKLHKHTARFLI